MLISNQAARRVALGTLAALVIAFPFVHIQPSRAATAVGGTYHPLTPARILDTRTGIGGLPIARLTAGSTINVQVAGQGGVPVAGVSAVVVNATATNTSAAGYLTVFPTGLAVPLASNLNWLAGQTVPNLVTIGLGATGKISAHNGSGLADVVFDVEGYFSTPDTSPDPAGLFNPLVPSRVLDTRSGNGAPMKTLGSAQTLVLQVTGRGGVPTSGASAVVLNLTVTAGQVSIFNGAGSTDVVADVNGWFTNSTTGGNGSRFTPVTPARIVDSRYGTGGFSTPWGPSSGRPIAVAGQGGVPLMSDPNPPTAVVVNITATDTTSASALIAWPDGAAQPLSSDLNWSRAATVPNLAWWTWSAGSRAPSQRSPRYRRPPKRCARTAAHGCRGSTTGAQSPGCHP